MYSIEQRACLQFSTYFISSQWVASSFLHCLLIVMLLQALNFCVITGDIPITFLHFFLLACLPRCFLHSLFLYFLALLLSSLTLLFFFACHSSEEDQGVASLQGSTVLSGAGTGAEGDAGTGSALGYVRYTWCAFNHSSNSDFDSRKCSLSVPLPSIIFPSPLSLPLEFLLSSFILLPLPPSPFL